MSKLVECIYKIVYETLWFFRRMKRQRLGKKIAETEARLKNLKARYYYFY